MGALVLKHVKHIGLWCFLSRASGYSFPVREKELSLARLCGYANLSALAAPLRLSTAGEVELLFARKLKLLEEVAPHLLWLRRGPLYTDDPHAGSVKLSSSRIPASSFTHTTTFKLLHDIEQFEYLASRGWRKEWLQSVVIPGYRAVLRRAEAALATMAQPGIESGYYQLGDLDAQIIGTTYNRALLFAPGDGMLRGKRLSNHALSTEVHWDQADARYSAGGGLSVVFIDNALRQEALDVLLDYCRFATLFFESKAHGAGGHLGAYVVDGFAAPILFQIAEELRIKLPRTLGQHPLRNFWAYKYSYSNSGIMVHKDQAAVNVNLWLSPNDGNLDPDRGGLKFFDDRYADLKMPFAVTPPELLGASGEIILASLSNVTVPFKQNRLVIFDSYLPHASDVGPWRSGYENRRISLTFLFGEPRSSV